MFKIVARALGTGAAIGSALLGAQAGSAAVTYTFDTTGGTAVSTTEFKSTDSKTDDYVASANYAATAGGKTINLHVTGWQASSDGKTVTRSTLGLWNQGIGVSSNGDTDNYFSGSINDHQIDNDGGVDFVMLQFSQAVSLTGLGRYVYGLATFPTGYTYNSDASEWADTAGALGSNWNTTVELASAMAANAANSYKSTANWADIAGTSSASNVDTETNPIGANKFSNKYSNVWLVGASFTGQGNDGFKLSSLTVAAVPEPASWAMMIVGFGAVGGTMRRARRPAPLTA